ncbi:hypothetical protein [Aestuariivivens marinum]|uniref:hypothetical protein n=1 Tax=Aestuariivivens marinum TaxID=2913555 RepID=UPI001F582A63|nr:hypothetical protein [Aestuariivivens marinum]
MNKSKFDEFKSYILKANRLNRSVIEIFQTLNNLKEDIKSEIIHLKPILDQYNYEATLDSLIHDLKKLGYPEEVDFTKIESWLKEFDTTKEELLLWHTENPNVTHWESNESHNNMLFEILYTELELMANLEYSGQEKFKHLDNITYSEIQLIQHQFEEVIKNSIVEELKLFLQELRKSNKPNVNDERYLTYKWFKVALLFATGEIDDLKSRFNNNATQIAKQKFQDNWKSYRPYISESMNNTIVSDKNIFSKNEKLLLVYNYCKNNDIRLSIKFSNLINSFKAN